MKTHQQHLHGIYWFDLARRSLEILTTAATIAALLVLGGVVAHIILSLTQNLPAIVQQAQIRSAM